MRVFSFIVFVLLMALGSSEAGEFTGGSAGGSGIDVEVVGHGSLSLSELEEREDVIGAALAELAHYTPRGGIGPVGYRSAVFGGADEEPWVEVDLGEEVAVDEVVLVPCLIRDPVSGYRADAFPQGVRISTEGGELLAELKKGEIDLPRVAPLVISLGGQKASVIRVGAKDLMPRAFDGRRLMQFSEILIFSGERNVALRRPVKVSKLSKDEGAAWNPANLTDGSLPYLMNSARGEPSVAYLSLAMTSALEQQGEELSLNLDLGESRELSGVRLHAVDQSDTVPQQAASGIGMPAHLLIEGAQKADFSDARVLLDNKRGGSYDVSPLMMWPLREMRCRYVRIRSLDPLHEDSLGVAEPRIGFAEIELLSEGKNVARGKVVSTQRKAVHTRRSLEAMTDGRNVYGEIRPLRRWLHELARRHALEKELPLLKAELELRYDRQKERLRWVSLAAVGLVVVVIFLILVHRMLEERKISRMKERFAADLHDEIGAKVHGIGMLSDLAGKAISSPEKLRAIHQDIRGLTERLGRSVRYCTDLLEAEGLYTDMETDMRRMAERLSIDYELKIEGRDFLDGLSQQVRLDLLLFYRECLVNINRHAEASRLMSRLSAGEHEVNLVVADNGGGLAGRVPGSLRRRARLMGGRVSSESPPGGGSEIRLKMKIRRKHKKKS